VSSLCSELARRRFESTSNRRLIRSSQSEISRIVLGSKFSGQSGQSSSHHGSGRGPALGRVLDERHHIRAAVEAGQIQEPEKRGETVSEKRCPTPLGVKGELRQFCDKGRL
jgi:hypothetical protein